MKDLKNIMKIDNRENIIIYFYIIIFLIIAVCNIVMFRDCETIDYYYNQRRFFYNCKVIKTNGNYIDKGTPKEFYLVITEDNDTLNYVSIGNDLTTKNMISFYNNEFIEYNPDKLEKTQEYKDYINFDNFYTRLVTFYALTYLLYFILFIYSIFFISNCENETKYLNSYSNVSFCLVMLAILFFDLFNF